MADTFLFKNNVVDAIAAAIDGAATSITVADGTQFPSPGVYETAALELRNTSDNSREIVYLTARSGNVLTIVRGQEGTGALSFPAGSEVTMPITAGILDWIKTL